MKQIKFGEKAYGVKITPKKHDVDIIIYVGLLQKKINEKKGTSYELWADKDGFVSYVILDNVFSSYSEALEYAYEKAKKVTL